jgi:hypothetical protein
MPIFDSSESSKAPRYATHEAAKGIRMSPGPFVGEVKNNIDPMRTGRLQVFIAELGGNPDDQSSWRTVVYASPFAGVTPPPQVNGANSLRANQQDFATNPHSYGFFMVPPDIGVNVLCTFVNGDPFKGYWFACIPDWPNSHMIPAIGYSDTSQHPVVEFNNDYEPASSIDSFWARQTTEHTIVTGQYQTQGLLNDPMRGPISSTIYRESPSGVFGFSTPGRKLKDPWVNCNGTQAPINTNSDGRMGGHSLVMDDGDVNGNNQLMRLRTAQGHQIMMNDAGGFIHVINSSGTAWFEMDNYGNINFYANGQFNVKAKGSIQLDSDQGVTISSKQQVNISAQQNLNISSIGSVNINCIGFTRISSASGLHLKGTNTYLTGSSCIQINGGQHMDLYSGCITLNSARASPAQGAGNAIAASGMPTQEPWFGHARCNSGSSNASQQALATAINAASSIFTNFNTTNSTNNASTSSNPSLFNSINQSGAAAMAPVYANTSTGNTAILNTIKQQESGGNYNATNPNSSASGAYQYTDATWQKQAAAAGVDINQYPRAYMAPPAVQDMVAAKNVDNILQQNGGDVTKVPNVWYTGNANGNMTPQQLAANNGQTADAYQAKWMAQYNQQASKDQANPSGSAGYQSPTDQANGVNTNGSANGAVGSNTLQYDANKPVASQTGGNTAPASDNIPADNAASTANINYSYAPGSNVALANYTGTSLEGSRYDLGPSGPPPPASTPAVSVNSTEGSNGFQPYNYNSPSDYSTFTTQGPSAPVTAVETQPLPNVTTNNIDTAYVRDPGQYSGATNFPAIGQPGYQGGSNTTAGVPGTQPGSPLDTIGNNNPPELTGNPLSGGYSFNNVPATGQGYGLAAPTQGGEIQTVVDNGGGNPITNSTPGVGAIGGAGIPTSNMPTSMSGPSC